MNVRIRYALVAMLSSLAVARVPLAQGRNVEDTKIIDSHRLTMPVLRKVLPALNAPGAQSCPRDGTRDPHTMSITDMVRMIERCQPVVNALKGAGVTTRDGVVVFASLLRTAKEVALHSGKASAIAPGVLRDNALLVEQNDPEIRRLTKAGGPS